MEVEQIEQRIDRVVANTIPVSRSVGGVAITSMAEVFELAKMMSVSGVAVPKHLRTQPGACLAVCIQAFEWQMSPFAVANKSYAVNDRLAYESQLIHAVVEARAPLEKRLRDTYKGEGPTRQCTISGTLKGDATPFEYTSPMLQDIKVKNSPLWVGDPDQQLFYYSSRAWARRYVPDVLLGIYSADELAEIGEGPGSAVDITPSETTSRLAERLQAGKDGTKGRGFDVGNVDRALEHKPGEVVPTAASVNEALSAETADEKPKGKRKAKPAEVTDVETGKGQNETQSTGTPESASQVNGITEGGTAGPDETAPQVYAREFIEKVEAHLAGTEAPKTLDDLRQYKTDMRGLIDKLEGLTPDEVDVLRGRFTTTILTAERGLAKKKGGKR